jgi:DNA-binding CsgD family transcriptional regulator
MRRRVEEPGFLVFSRAPILTRTEARILELVAAGLTNSQVASRLHVTTKDVEYHLGHLLSKFECSNRTGVVARAFVLGYLPAEGWPPVAQRHPGGKETPN